MTLIPVSRISWVGVRSSTAGAGRWIGQRSVALHRRAVVDRLAEQVEDPAQRLLADRDGDRTAGVDHLGAALQAVGGVHRHRADAVVAEVLLDLADELAGALLLVSGHLDRQRRVDLGELVGEDGVDDDARHLLDASDVRSVRLSHSFLFSRGSAKRLGAADYFQDLLRDLRLPDPVHLQRQVARSCLRVLRGAAHRGHPRAQLRGRRLEQRPVDREVHVLREQLAEQLLGLRLVDPERASVRLLDLGLLASASSSIPSPKTSACCSGSSVWRRTYWVSGET